MQVLRFVFLILIFFKPIFANWTPESQAFTSHLDAKEYRIIEKESVVWLGHSTQFWDEKRSTFDGTRRLLRFAAEKNLYTIATIAPAMMSDPNSFPLHYFHQKEIDLVIESVAGGHRLQFPLLKNIFFAGGNLNRCLCEGIRDVAIGLYEASSFYEVNFYIVTDAVYAAYNPYSPIVKKSVAQDFAKAFFVPAFKCPLQNWSRPLERRKKMPNVLMRVFFEGEQIIEYDLEPNDGLPLSELEKKINVHFIKSSELDKL